MITFTCFLELNCLVKFAAACLILFSICTFFCIGKQCKNDRKVSSDEKEMKGLRKNFSRTGLDTIVENESTLSSTVREYQFAVIIGIGVCVYWITTFPLLTYWLIMEIMDINFYSRCCCEEGSFTRLVFKRNVRPFVTYV